jgi:hypothetical protein
MPTPTVVGVAVHSVQGEAAGVQAAQAPRSILLQRIQQAAPEGLAVDPLGQIKLVTTSKHGEQVMHAPADIVLFIPPNCRLLVQAAAAALNVINV